MNYLLIYKSKSSNSYAVYVEADPDAISDVRILSEEADRIATIPLAQALAAPDLLDCAKAIVTAYGDKILPTHTEKHLLDGARAAIAKAGGAA